MRRATFAIGAARHRSPLFEAARFALATCDAFVDTVARLNSSNALAEERAEASRRAELTAFSACAMAIPPGGRVAVTALSALVPADAMDTLGDIDDASIRDVLAAHPAVFSLESDAATKKLVVSSPLPMPGLVAALLACGYFTSREDHQQWVHPTRADLAACCLQLLYSTTDAAPVHFADSTAVVNKSVRLTNRTIALLTENKLIRSTPPQAPATAGTSLYERLRGVLPTIAPDASARLFAQAMEELRTSVANKPAMAERFELRQLRTAQPAPTSQARSVPTIAPPSAPALPPVLDLPVVATAEVTLAEAALAAIPEELVPVNAESRTMLVGQLNLVAGHTTRLEFANDLLALSAAIDALPVAEGAVALEALFREHVPGLWEMLDVVQCNDTWLPKTPPPQPPVDHLGLLYETERVENSVGDPTGAAVSDGGENSAANDDASDADVTAATVAAMRDGGDAALFDDSMTSGLLSGDRRSRPERQWLHRQSAPQKVLIEPFSLHSIGSRSVSTIEAWVGTVTARRTGEAVVRGALDAEELVHIAPGVPRLFIRVLPPFLAVRRQVIEAHLTGGDPEARIAGEGSSAPTWDEPWLSFTALDYDVLRLARTLSAVDTTPLLELLRRGVGGVLGNTDVQFLIAARPHYFEYIPPAGADAVDVRNGGRVRFIVGEQFKYSGKPRVWTEIIDQMQQLRVERREAPRHKRYRITRKIIELKNLLVHAEHPGPHPLMDPDVLALFVFDLLPTDSPVEADTLYSVMPRAARLGPSLVTAFFNRYQHLFKVFEMGINPVTTFIQRADLPLPSQKAPEELSEEEILEAVKSPFVFGSKENRCTTLSFVAGRLLKTYRTAIDQRYGSLQGYIDKYPHVFVQYPDEQTEGPTARLRGFGRAA
jgi:hypothetical protein